MKTIITFTLLILSCNFIFAQYETKDPYQRVQFENLDPIYFETFYDPDFRKLGSDGYNCFGVIETILPLLYNNLYYNIYYNNIDGKGLFSSYYLSCTDFDTGRLVWQQKVFFADVPNVELPRLMKINDGGELVIIGQKKVSAYDGREYLDDLILFERRYDAMTGDFISLDHLSYTDTESYKMSYNYFYEGFLFLEEGDNYRIVELTDVDRKIAYKSALIDNKGKLVGKVDTLIYKYYNEEVYDVNLKVVGKDSLVLIEIGLDSTDRAFIAVRYLTNELKPLSESIILSPIRINLPSIKLLAVSPDKFKLLTVAPQPETDSLPFRNAVYLIINLKTNTIKRISTNFGGSTYLDWYSDDESMMVARAKINVTNDSNPQPNMFQFARLYDDFRVEIVREHKLVGLSKVIEYSYAYNYKDKEVLHLYEGAFYYDTLRMRHRQDIFALAHSIIAFKKGDFLPLDPSATADILVRPEVTIYPNPGSDEMQIRTSAPWSRLVIRSILGQKVLERKTTELIDISTLSPGLYLVDILFTDGQHQTLRYVKL